MSSKWHKVIGIDLGTTYSAVAAYNTFLEKVEIIKNPESENPETTASVVSFDSARRKVLVGSAAKRYIATAPDNTIIEIKREMGELFRPETLSKYSAQGIYTPQDPVKVRFAALPQEWMLPQQVSAFTLMKMKEVAEREIGEEIRDAVITVPAYFKEKQRKATEEAALLAGLYPRQLIPEPTAAAICYGVDRQDPEKRIYLVYDLGGGTFDVSIIQVEGGNIEVIATSGDPRLGGGDFDDAIVRWALGQLIERGIDLRNDAPGQARLKDRAEFAKVALSYGEVAKLDLAFLRNPNLPSLELTRDTFVHLVDDLLRKSLTFVDMALNAAINKGVQRTQIDAILLVGGSSKIPRVKQLLLDYFQKDENFVRSELNPDTVVARGAAIMANRCAPTPGPFDIKRKNEATLVNTDAVDVQEVRLITEHSLGIGVQDNRVVRVVEQGTNIPIEVRRGGFTNGGPVPFVDVPVFQGEDQFQYNNTLIGTLKIGQMELKPEGFHKFDVVFSLDRSGLLTMVVHHLNENKTYQATFEQKTGVGGDEALVAMRNRLLGLYAHATAAPVQLPPQPDNRGTPHVPPPPPPPGMSAAPPPAPGGWTTTAPPPPAGMPMPGVPAPPWQPTPPVQAGPAVAPPPPAPAPAQPPGPPQQPAAAPPPAASPILEAKSPVPDEFKSTVRRTQKQLMKAMDPALLAAFNKFITLLDKGAPSTELEEAGDDLAAALEDARR